MTDSYIIPITELIEPRSLLVTLGNGNMLSRTLHELRGDRFNDIQEDFYYGCICTGRTPYSPLPVFDKWIGKYGPSGPEIRELYAKAAVSDLTSTGMSDRKRHEREIQRVGTDAAASGDITFRALSNYKDFQGGKAGGVATHGVRLKSENCVITHLGAQCALGSVPTG